MNMVMNNDGSGNILPCNSLDPPHLWSDDLKVNLQPLLVQAKIKSQIVITLHSLM